jgi:hypothetical protein
MEVGKVGKMIRARRTLDWKERIEEGDLGDGLKEFALKFKKPLPAMKDGDVLKLHCIIKNIGRLEADGSKAILFNC